MTALMRIAMVAAVTAIHAAPTLAQDHRSRMLDLGGHETEVLEWGSGGPHIVLLHADLFSPHEFDTFAVHFASRYHVVAFARRGHGKSTARPFTLDDLIDDLRTVMDSLDIERATLMGNGFGGMEISRFAVLHPDRVERLVFLDAHYEFAENPHAMDAATTGPKIECLHDLTSRSGLRTCMADYVVPRVEWSPSLEELFDDMFVDSAGLTTYRGLAVSPSKVEVIGAYRPEYSRITAPALFLVAGITLSSASANTAWNRRVEEWHESSYRRARDWWVEHIPEQLKQAKMVIVESTSKIGIVYSDRTFEEVDRFLAETMR
jgi:pimeloyl-ACP methyl ester carboxylesterase